MDRKQKTYIAWLQNAYGQEICMARMYAMHAKDAAKGLNKFPELKDGLERHATASRQHAERIRECLLRVSEQEPFIPKVWLGNVMGVVLGWTGDITVDKVIMNNLTDYGMINFEIAAYQTLVSAAREMNDDRTALVCHRILEEERLFAHWLEQYVGPTAQSFLDRVEALS